MLLNNGVVNEHKYKRPSVFFLWQRTKATVRRGVKLHFQHCISQRAFKPNTHNSLQSTTLCIHIMQRLLGAKQRDKHTGPAAWTCSATRSHTPVFTDRSQYPSCLQMTKKTTAAYQQVKPLRARPSMGTLAPLCDYGCFVQNLPSL